MNDLDLDPATSREAISSLNISRSGRAAKSTNGFDCAADHFSFLERSLTPLRTLNISSRVLSTAHGRHSALNRTRSSGMAREKQKEYAFVHVNGV